MRWLLIAVLLSGLLVACGSEASPDEVDLAASTATPDYCSTADGEKVADLIQEFMDEYIDTLELAASTSRMALSPQIAELQRIRREVGNQEWPECAQRVHVPLVAAMDSHIDAFLAFLSDEPDSEVERLGNQGVEYFETAVEELQKIRPSDTQ